MVVCSCDARIAETAVLAPCGFGEVACPALGVGVEDVIVGVALEVEGVCGGCYGVQGGGACAEVAVEVGLGKQYEDPELLGEGKLGP